MHDWTTTAVCLWNSVTVYKRLCLQLHAWMDTTTCLTLTSNSYITLCTGTCSFRARRWSDVEYKGCTHHHIGVSNCLHFVHIVIFNGGIKTRVEIVQKVHNLQHRKHILRPVKNIEFILYRSHFRGFEGCGRPGQPTRRGGKMNILNGGKNWFSALKKLKITENNARQFSKRSWFYSKFIISIREGECSYSPRR